MKRMLGFTLLETLMALVLLSLLLLLIAGSALTAKRTVHNASSYAARLEEIRAAQSFLSIVLQSRVAIHLYSSGRDSSLFEGGADVMRFVAAVPAGLGGQLKINSIRVIPDASAQQLQASFFNRNDDHAWGEPQVLTSQLRTVRFTYQGLDEQGRPTGWLSVWPWPERFPEAIRIEADALGPIRWSTLTIRLPGSVGKPL